MKRVYLLLTLFIASFFFISLNKVKADTFDYVIPSNEISIVETDFFKEIRDLAIEKANSNNRYYLITIKVSDINVSNLIVNLFDKGSYNITDVAYNIKPTFNYNNAKIKEYLYSTDSSTLFYNGMNNYPSFNFTNIDENNNSIYSHKVYLDSNIELLPFSSTQHTVNLHYNDFVYTVNPGEHYPSLYELKLLNDSSSDSGEIEKNNSLDSFYSLVIERVQIFSNNFISNDIFLFIIGIFLLIFTFELVRRWL